MHTYGLPVLDSCMVRGSSTTWSSIQFRLDAHEGVVCKRLMACLVIGYDAYESFLLLNIHLMT